MAKSKKLETRKIGKIKLINRTAFAVIYETSSVRAFNLAKSLLDDFAEHLADYYKQTATIDIAKNAQRVNFDSKLRIEILYRPKDKNKK